MDRIDAMKAFDTALNEASFAGAETSAPRGTISLTAPAELENVLYQPTHTSAGRDGASRGIAGRQTFASGRPR